ncbi:MAG: fibronectin type III domain-containing protein [Planctomycetia bacterium]|nr:fibronectin type III domain-containing protein [Planctomycetia bacterium]
MTSIFRWSALLENCIADWSKERKNRENRKGGAPRKPAMSEYRKFAMEPLESRELLAVTLAEFETIRSAFPELTFGSYADTNIIEVAAAELATVDLQKVVNEAAQTSQSDLVVLRTTDSFNAINLNGETISIGLGAQAGSLSFVGWGDSFLQVTSTDSVLFNAKSGLTQLGNMNLVGLTTLDNQFATSDLVKTGSGATLAVDKVVYMTELCASDSPFLTGTSYTLANRVGDAANCDITMEFNVSGSNWACISGLTASNALNYQKLVYRTDGYDIGLFYDAEKYGDGIDSMLCWAAASSNALFYTGWANESIGFSNEDEVFAYYTDHFTDEGSNSYYGYDWFITGNYDAPDDFAQLEKEGGGFYPNVDINSIREIFFYDDSPGASLIGNTANLLKSNYGVTISLGWGEVWDPNVRNGGHAITLWGYTYNTNYSPTDPRYYSGLLVSDSDDDYGLGASAPNKCVLLSLEWSDLFGRYRFNDYGYGGGWLEGFFGIAKNPNSVWLESPQNFTVTQSGAQATAELTWNAVSGADTYVLQYSTDPTFAYNEVKKAYNYETITIAASGTGTCSYTMSGLEFYKDYYFRIQAQSDDAMVRESSFAGPLNFRAEPPKEASQPVNFTVTSVKPGEKDTSTSLRISWEAGFNAFGYEVQYSTDYRYSEEVTQTAFYTNAGSYLLSNLDPGTTYFVRIKSLAREASYDSAWVSKAAMTRNLAVTLATPSNLKATPETATSVKLEWDEVEKASKYQVSWQIKDSGAVWNSFDIVDNFYMLTGRERDVTYTFKVRALGTGSYINSDASAEVAFTTGTTLDAPVVKAETEPDSITLTWSSITYAESYRVEEYNVGTKKWEIKADTIVDTTWTTSATAKSEHTYRVVAVPAEEPLKEAASAEVTVVVPTDEDIRLDKTAFLPNLPKGDEVGTFLDSLEGKTLVDGKGNNDKFEIVDNKLVTKAKLGEGTYTIFVEGATSSTATEITLYCYQPVVTPLQTVVSMEKSGTVQLSAKGQDALDSPLTYTWKYLDSEGNSHEKTGASISFKGSELFPADVKVEGGTYYSDIKVSVENEYGLVSEERTIRVQITDRAYVKAESVRLDGIEEKFQKLKLAVSSVPVGKWVINWGDNTVPTTVRANSNEMYFTHYYKYNSPADGYKVTWKLYTTDGVEISDLSLKEWKIVIPAPPLIDAALPIAASVAVVASPSAPSADTAVATLALPTESTDTDTVVLPVASASVPTAPSVRSQAIDYAALAAETTARGTSGIVDRMFGSTTARKNLFATLGDDWAIDTDLVPTGSDLSVWN